jgi:orotate phosphoribosyltransferase
MNEVIDILKRIGAIITDDHFVYTSGKHGEVYVNKDAVYPHTAETSRVCELMAERFKGAGVDVVVGPALGGIILSTWTAFHLSRMEGREVLGVYTDKDEQKNQIFTRGYGDLVRGKNVLVVEDITNTGGSARKVVEAVRAAGGTPVGACVMVNRDPTITDETIGTRFEALAVFPAQAWEESELPEHIRSRPVNTKVGHGKKYMDARTSTA